MDPRTVQGEALCRLHQHLAAPWRRLTGSVCAAAGHTIRRDQVVWRLTPLEPTFHFWELSSSETSSTLYGKNRNLEVQVPASLLWTTIAVITSALPAQCTDIVAPRHLRVRVWGNNVKIEVDRGRFRTRSPLEVRNSNFHL